MAGGKLSLTVEATGVGQKVCHLYNYKCPEDIRETCPLSLLIGHFVLATMSFILMAKKRRIALAFHHKTRCVIHNSVIVLFNWFFCLLGALLLTSFPSSSGQTRPVGLFVGHRVIRNHFPRARFWLI